MAKDKTAYVCSNCGQESAKWIGKCPSCGQWNTCKEIRIAADTGTMAAKSAAMTVRHAHASGKGNKPLRLSEIAPRTNRAWTCTTPNSTVCSAAGWCQGR